MAELHLERHRLKGHNHDKGLPGDQAGRGVVDRLAGCLASRKNGTRVELQRLHGLDSRRLGCGTGMLRACGWHAARDGEVALADALTQAGVKIIPQYSIAGRLLDLAVVHPLKVDVEVDGESVHRTAGGGRKDDDSWRDLQLQSLGWRVCRFWVYELRENLPRCVRRVAELVED